ncbi:MAG: hypothetical protein PUB05_04265 [Firmicutes bacterium]|nr:hypothetical protein [Bacillota bacterium]
MLFTIIPVEWVMADLTAGEVPRQEILSTNPKDFLDATAIRLR